MGNGTVRYLTERRKLQIDKQSGTICTGREYSRSRRIVQSTPTQTVEPVGAHRNDERRNVIDIH